MSQHQETLWEKCFGTPDRTIDTLLHLSCLDPDNFEDCLDCPFCNVDPCPAYPYGTQRSKPGQPTLADVLKDTVN